MADYAPVNGGDVADTVTYTAGAAITGGDVLVFSAPDTVVPCAVNPANFAGIAAHDAASGAPVTVWTGAGLVHETAIAAGVTFGSPLYAGAGGKVTGTIGTGFGATVLGFAVRTVAGAGVQRWKALVG